MRVDTCVQADMGVARVHAGTNIMKLSS